MMYLNTHPQTKAIEYINQYGLEDAMKIALRRRITMNFEYYDLVLDNLITLALEK